jgi:hypothetical protein
MFQKLTPFAHSFLHGVVAFAVFAVPLLLAQNQKLGDLTVSSIVLFVLHYIENKYGATPTA